MLKLLKFIKFFRFNNYIKKFLYICTEQKQ